MTEREKRMIEGYLPHGRDPELEDFCYYILDNNSRVRKVYVSEINPSSDPHSDEEVYGVRYASNGNRYLGYPGYGNIQMSQLYDNREDCKKQTHPLYNGWETLRELQNKEI